MALGTAVGVAEEARLEHGKVERRDHRRRFGRRNCSRRRSVRMTRRGAGGLRSLVRKSGFRIRRSLRGPAGNEQHQCEEGDRPDSENDAARRSHRWVFPGDRTVWLAPAFRLSGHQGRPYPAGMPGHPTGVAVSTTRRSPGRRLPSPVSAPEAAENPSAPSFRGFRTLRSVPSISDERAGSDRRDEGLRPRWSHPSARTESRRPTPSRPPPPRLQLAWR